MRMRAKVAVVVGLAVAATVAPVARADVLEVGSDSEEQVEHRQACAWWGEETATGFTSVLACAAEHAGGDSAWVDADRYECDTVGHRTECHITSYHGRADVFDIDMEAGTAAFTAQLGDCAVDVAITGDERDGYESEWEPEPFVDGGRVGVEDHGYAGEEVRGPATGSVCGWAEAAGEGEGRLDQWTSTRSSTWVRPDYGLFSPVLSHGTEREQRSASACGFWSTEEGVHVWTCGTVDEGVATYLEAGRYACDSGGPVVALCTGEYVRDDDPDPGEVAIDDEAGTALIDGDAGDCLVDVTVSVSEWSDERHGHTGEVEPSAGTEGVTVSQRRGYYSRYGSGAAAGDVCGWAEAGDGGSGSIYSWGEQHEYVRVGPSA